jgi:TrmH family RNA methyltransferase
VVVAGIQDPGNVGALARTAEAAGASALFVVEGGCSPFNAKALRGSMGSLLRLPVLRPSAAAEAFNELSGLGVHQVVAATRGGARFDAFTWKGPVALWFSGEAGRLDFSGGAAPEAVTIPLQGGVESLNVGAAAAVLCFAARAGLDQERDS